MSAAALVGVLVSLLVLGGVAAAAPPAPASERVGRVLVISIPAIIWPTLVSRFSWVSCTPFGLPVLPEVYWSMARSPGSTAAS